MNTNVKDIFQYVNSQIGFRFITPINLMEENKKLEIAITDGKVYHPVFQYPDTSNIDFEYMKSLLSGLKFGNSAIDGLYQKVCIQKLQEVTMYSKVGSPKEFTEASENLYGKPDETLRDEAYRILNLPDRQEEVIYDAHDLVKRFEEKLHQYHLDSWNVIETNEMGSKVLVGNEKIWVNSNYRFSENNLNRLCAHEISTHVLRYENGKQRNDPIFREGTSHSMETEEGLAIYNEELAGALNLQTLKLYAARFLCTLSMNDKSLYELVLMIKDYVGLQQAIYIASRIKVGLCETKSQGGFNKDYIYLQGYLNVKHAIQNRPSVYRELYTGRISLEDLGRLSSYIQNVIDKNEIILPVLESYTNE